MGNGIRCIDCFWFGYFRVEQLRGGGTTYFHPETLPLQARELLLKGLEPAFRSTILALLARDTKVACLSETTDALGQRHAVEPAYDALSAEDDNFSGIRRAACVPRQCPHFGVFDGSVSFSDVRALQQKAEVDRVATRILQKQREHRNAVLLSQLNELANDTGLTPQQRGKRFEDWFQSLCAASNLRHSVNVQNDWEQLDFTVWLGNTFCVGEARWVKDPVDTKQVRDFFGKIMDRPPFVIGILVSISGFTSPALDWIESHTHDRTILTVDRDALTSCILGPSSFESHIIEQLNQRLNHPRS